MKTEFFLSWLTAQNFSGGEVYAWTTCWVIEIPLTLQFVLLYNENIFCVWGDFQNKIGLFKNIVLAINIETSQFFS